MVIKTFPDVKVEIKQSPFSNSSYLRIFFSFEKSPAGYIILDAVESIEREHKLLGKTIDEYFKSAVEKNAKNPHFFSYSEQDFIDGVINDLMPKRLFCAVLLKDQYANAPEFIFTSEAPVISTISEDKQSLERLIFTPSSIFTQQVLGFSYELINLRRIEPY
ncbi:MAG: hypothetical protein QXT20_00370 [Candidatus Woesearchaeota archaeon]